MQITERFFFDEKDVTKVPPENRNIGMVFQNYALYPHLRIKGNIEFPLVNSPKMKKRLRINYRKKRVRLLLKKL